MWNKIFTLILVSFFTLNAASATQVQKASVQKVELSFEQAYELMLANNNAIKATLEEIKEKKYQKNAAFGHYLPKITAGSDYFHFDDPIQVGMGPLGSLTLQDQNLWMARAGVAWNIFTGGKVQALNAAARAKLEGTNEKYRLIANDLTSELVKRYYGLRLAQDVIVVRKQVYDGTKRHLEDAKKLEEAGVIPKSERLHAEVAFTQAQREYEASIRDANIVEEGLKTLIKADNVDLKGVEVSPASSLFIYKNDFAKLEEFKKLAMEKNPNLKQVEVKKKLAQANYRSELANYSPTVSVFAYDIFASRDQSHQLPSWALGASVNWMLFDGLTRENNLKAANCVRKQVEYEKIDAQNNVESLVVKKYEELMKYKEQYESTNKSIESANEALRVTTTAFKEGFSTSLSVVDAQMALSKVKIERLNAVYNYDITLVELLKTNGGSEEILNYIKNSTGEKL